MTLAGSNHSLVVETTTFLGACIGCVVLLVAVVLYLSSKWYFIPPATAATLFGGVCVPICKSSDNTKAKNLDVETNSNTKAEALRQLSSRNLLPLNTLMIQAEDGFPNILDIEPINTNICSKTHDTYQQQCIVEVSSPNVIIDNIENRLPIHNENVTTSATDRMPSLTISTEEIASLEVAFLYDAPMREMTVHVLQGRKFPSGIGGSQVRLVLLPSRKQRRKTRVRQGSSPQYMESFLLPRVNPEDVNAMGIRVRVYLWGGRMRKERLLGEARISFDLINLRLETTLWLTLQLPQMNSVQNRGHTPSLTRSNSTGSQQSVQSYALSTTPPYGSSMKGGSIAEILIGLTYNGTTGCLSVEIIKGSHFRGERGNDTKPPDTYVKLVLVDSNGHEIGRAKTGLRRAQPNPLYKDTFIFQVALFQLGDVALYLSVYNRRRTAMGKKGHEIIGWLCLGQSSSGADELQHWNEMRAARQPMQIQRWHSLLRP